MQKKKRQRRLLLHGSDWQWNKELRFGVKHVLFLSFLKQAYRRWWKEDKNRIPFPFQLYIKDGNHTSRELLQLIQLIHQPLFGLKPNSHWSQGEYFLCLLCWNGLSLSQSSGKAENSPLAKVESALSSSSRNAKATACQTSQRGLAELVLPSPRMMHLERSHSKMGSAYHYQRCSTVC